jgi:hypothetical protein
MSSDQIHVEAFSRQVYADINEIWASRENFYPTWKLGFRILYSPPIFRPNIMLVGENPGCLLGQVYSTDEQAGWPTHNEYVVQNWPLARKLQSLFSQIGAYKTLESSVGLNVNFFRSHSSKSREIGLRWRDNPPRLRRELEGICLQKVIGLIKVMEPTIVLALGMTAFDALTQNGGTAILTRKGDGARLCAMGNINGTKIAGVIHPTGAQVSNEDLQGVMTQVNTLMAD